MATAVPRGFLICDGYLIAHPFLMMNKHTIRKKIIEKRNRLTDEQVRTASDDICKKLLCSPLFDHAEHVAAYLPHNNEVDLTPVITALADAGKHCYLPALQPSHPNTMIFLPYQPGDPLKENRYGISEPLQNASTAFPPEQLDIALLPLVAFDQNKQRIGMGAGYYDRAFAFLRDTHTHTPMLIGVAYALQETTPFKTDEWDIPLNDILTNSNF